MLFRLKQIRTAKSLTLDQLAEATGLSKGFLSQLETGARQPSTETLRTLSEILQVPEVDLIAPSGFSEPGSGSSTVRRVLSALDGPNALTPPPKSIEQDFKIGTDGSQVQIIATVDKDGLRKLIRQLEAMVTLLEA